MINLKKCFLWIVYLGFGISTDGLRMDPKKVKEILELPTPKNVGEVRLFYGLASFYGNFIKNFSFVCNAMTETMRGDKKDFKWTHGVDKSFETLKQKVVSYLYWLCLIPIWYFRLNVMHVVVQ